MERDGNLENSVKAMHEDISRMEDMILKRRLAGIIGVIRLMIALTKGWDISSRMTTLFVMAART